MAAAAVASPHPQDDVHCRVFLCLFLVLSLLVALSSLTCSISAADVIPTSSRAASRRLPIVLVSRNERSAAQVPQNRGPSCYALIVIDDTLFDSS